MAIMYDDDDDFDYSPDEFNELDELVEIAQESISGKKAAGETGLKYYTSNNMVELMLQEVPPQDVRIFEQAEGRWVTEVLYKGITFVTVTLQEPDWEMPDEDDNDY